jgi:hypothetical protein
METVGQAVDRLHRAGYTEQFRIEDGKLVALGSHRSFAPEELSAEEQLRFEGISDPDDEALVLALASDDATVRGTLCVAYGPAAPPEEADVVRQIRCS